MTDVARPWEWHRVREGCDCWACQDRRAGARQIAALAAEVEQWKNSHRNLHEDWEDKKAGIARRDAQLKAFLAVAQAGQQILDECRGDVTGTYSSPGTRAMTETLAALRARRVGGD